MTAPFARVAGEWLDADQCDRCWTCGLSSYSCECEIDPPSMKSRAEVRADYEAAVAHIEKCCAEKVEAELRATIEMQKRKAA